MAMVPLKSCNDRMSVIKTAMKELDSDVEIVSSEGDILLTNSFLLSLASPFLQSLLHPLLPTDNATSARIYLPDISKLSLSHLLNILKQGYSTGLGAGNSIREEVHEAARALRFTELSVITMVSNNEYFEEAGDGYEKMIKSEWYCILCQMSGHTLSEACVVNARCHSCGVKGHVRRDCKSKIKREVKREYGDTKEEKYELKSMKDEVKIENWDCKEEKCDTKDIKLDIEKEKINYEEEYIELESPKEEEKEIGKEADKCEDTTTIDTNDFEAARLPLVHQELQQPSNSYSPRGNKAGPAETKRKLPKRKRKVSHGSYLENSEDDSPKVKNGKKKRPKLDDEGHANKEYRCTKCDYETTQKSHLKRHVQSVHKGVKYQCPECDYQATQKIHLKRHVKSVHEGVKFQCPECDYQATQKIHLKLHVESIHEGVKFPCPECDYEATQKIHLKRHVKRKHDSVSEDMMSPKKGKKSSAMTSDLSLHKPSTPTTNDQDSGSSDSRHGGKQQPKRKAKENKKIPVENDLNDSITDSDDTDRDEDYEPEPE